MEPADGIEPDPDDRFIRDAFWARLNALKNADGDRCPPAEILLDYHQGNLGALVKRRIQDHIITCPFCLDALEAVQRTEEPGVEKGKSPKNWPSIEKALDTRFYASLQPFTVPSGKPRTVPDRKKTERPLGRTRRAFWTDVFKPRRLVYAGTLAVLALLISYACAYLSRDPYFSIARITPEQRRQLRSEATPSPFREGMTRYDQGKYVQAITQFNLYIRTHPDHYASRYYLGLSHLANAEKRLLGLPCKFNEMEVAKGIFNLEKAFLLAGDNSYYRADCYWYLGKAFLMRGEAEKAKEQFSDVLSLDSADPVREKEAEKLIFDINQALSQKR